LKDRGSQIGRGISLSEDKYNFYLSAAQIYLKQGRYYRAVDSFTLASIYKPKDPLAYVGKSHALFAAGEYISSALFLSRALDPDVHRSQGEFQISNFKFEVPQDELNSRIADAEERLKISGAPELHFLLGYIYYQIGKIDAASKAINEAHKKLPSSKAVCAVKKAVDEAMNQNIR
jgi:tetratricopeptide (TPR) repeat protein